MCLSTAGSSCAWFQSSKQWAEEIGEEVLAAQDQFERASESAIAAGV